MKTPYFKLTTDDATKPACAHLMINKFKIKDCTVDVQMQKVWNNVSKFLK